MGDSPKARRLRSHGPTQQERECVLTRSVEAGPTPRRRAVGPRLASSAGRHKPRAPRPLHAPPVGAPTLRLPSGAGLRREREARSRAPGGAAFVLCGIGSLPGVQIRQAAEEHESRPDGPFEILTLAGSPSRDGARLHMAVANASDDVTGGHACYGCTVRTTAEAPVVRLDRGALERELGQAIGLKAMAARNL